MADLIERLRHMADNHHAIKDCAAMTEAASTIESLQAEIERLRETLTFYRDEWKKAEHSIGFAGPDMIPTHKLLCDYGERARSALSPQAPKATA